MSALGLYVCELHFAELSRDVKTGDRVFNIEIHSDNDSIQRLTNIDLIQGHSLFSPRIANIGPIKVKRYIKVLVRKLPSSKLGGLISGIKVYPYYVM